MNPLAIYNGSNGDETKALYDRLLTFGPVGIIALNLFRAQKASARAKLYTRRFKGTAYDKKNWSMKLLCDALSANAAELGIEWGWREDPTQEYHRWVLYVDLPTGQVSFHSATRMNDRPYAPAWDGSQDSATRIIKFVETVLAR